MANETGANSCVNGPLWPANSSAILRPYVNLSQRREGAKRETSVINPTLRLRAFARDLQERSMSVATAGEPIQMNNGRLAVPDRPIVPFIEGDGTGPDIWRASKRVFD